jgi:O-antigen/teichoic acid export membrane protein
MRTHERYGADITGGPSRESRVGGLECVTTAGVGTLIAAGIWIAAPWINGVTVEQEGFTSAMRLFGLLVLLIGVVRIQAGVFRAVGSARGEVALNKLLAPAVRLVSALAALWLSYSVVGVAAAFVLGTGLLALVGFGVSVRTTGITPSIRGLRSEARAFYDHATPVAMSSVGKVFQSRVDLLLVGALLTAVAAGVYNVVLVLVAIAWIPLLSFNMLLPPVASDLYSEDRMETLNAVYSTVTRLIVTTVVPIIAVQVVYGRELLSLFGGTYVRGYAPLVVYLGGVFVGSAVGATGWLLMMTDHQYARMILDWLLAGLNVVLTYTFIQAFGLVGAALGTSLAIAVQNSLQVLLLYRFEGLWPFQANYLRPVAAGVAMMAVMAAVRAAIDGVLAVPVGVIAGLVAYPSTLVVLGVEPRDRFVVRAVTERYRNAIGNRL